MYLNAHFFSHFLVLFIVYTITVKINLYVGTQRTHTSGVTVCMFEI